LIKLYARVLVVGIKVYNGYRSNHIALICAYIIFSLSVFNYLIVPSFSVIGIEFNVSEAYVGLASATYLFVTGVSMLFWGLINDKVEQRKKLLLGILLATLISALLTSLVKEFGEFLAYQIIIAFFAGGSYPIVYSILSDVYGLDRRATIFSIIALIGSLGSGAGYAIGLFTGTSNWRLSFSIVAILVFLAFLLTLILKEPIRGESEDELKDILLLGFKYPFKPNLKLYKRFLMNRGNQLLVLEILFQSISWSAFAVWSLYAISKGSFSSILIASILLALISSGRIFQPMLAPLVDMLGAKRPFMKCIFAAIMVSIFILSTSLFLILLPPLEIYESDLIRGLAVTIYSIKTKRQLQIALLIGALGIFAESFDQPLREAALADINVPEIRGSGLALVNLIGLFGRSLGISITGFFAIYLGSLKKAIISSLVLGLLATVIWLIFGLKYAEYINKRREELKTRRNIILSSLRTIKKV